MAGLGKPAVGHGLPGNSIRNRIAGGDASLIGTGMGLRVVRAIVAPLGETTFQAEEHDGVLGATLELPGG